MIVKECQNAFCAGNWLIAIYIIIASWGDLMFAVDDFLEYFEVIIATIESLCCFCHTRFI